MKKNNITPFSDEGGKQLEKIEKKIYSLLDGLTIYQIEIIKKEIEQAIREGVQLTLIHPNQD